MTAYASAEQKLKEALSSFYDRGRMEERAAIVAWLRTASNGDQTIKYANVFADEIEAGEHVR